MIHDSCRLSMVAGSFWVYDHRQVVGLRSRGMDQKGETVRIDPAQARSYNPSRMVELVRRP